MRPALLLIICALAFVACGGHDDPPRADSKGSAARGEILRLRSEPKLRPPAVRVRRRSPRAAPGSIFVAPRKGAGQDGPLIVDGRGELVWFRRLTGGMTASDFKVQRYRGEPVLTWWQGRFSGGGGNGEYVIIDSSYREIARVQAARGLQGDLHEFELTEDGTALFFVYRTVGGVVDNIIQEVDVATGRLLFEWSALDHIPRRDSYRDRSRRPWDYAHLNSIDVLEDGHLLVSGRNTYAVYKVHRRTGRILWTMGGKSSDFRMGPGTQFAWAHDARRQPDGTITIFDNASAPRVRDESRGLVLGVQGRRVRLKRAYTHPRELSTHISAGVQRLPNGNAFIGWGATGFISEHTRGGRMVFNASFADLDNDTYRAYRFPWTGRPASRPKAAATSRGGRVTVYASWNGATEVRRWRVLAGPGADALEPAGTAPRRGFETAIAVRTDLPVRAVEALGAGREVLGRVNIR